MVSHCQRYSIIVSIKTHFGAPQATYPKKRKHAMGHMENFYRNIIIWFGRDSVGKTHALRIKRKQKQLEIGKKRLKLIIPK